MKSNKAKLAFHPLMAEMEVVSKERQLEFVGGVVNNGDATSGYLGGGSVTDYLSQAFGKTVTLSTDSLAACWFAGYRQSYI